MPLDVSYSECLEDLFLDMDEPLEKVAAVQRILVKKGVDESCQTSEQLNWSSTVKRSIGYHKLVEFARSADDSELENFVRFLVGQGLLVEAEPPLSVDLNKIASTAITNVQTSTDKLILMALILDHEEPDVTLHAPTLKSRLDRDFGVKIDNPNPHITSVMGEGKVFLRIPNSNGGLEFEFTENGRKKAIHLARINQN